jgi:hypothetical protein
MNAASASVPRLNQTVLARFLMRLATDAPLWWRSALAAVLVTALFAAASFVDTRLFNGVSVWDKPAKFMLSFAVHMLTFAWAFALMPETERRSRSNRVLSIVFIAIMALEMAYIVFRAARGEASHFNIGSPAAALAYSLMGAGAVTLTAITFWFGWRLIRSRSDVAAHAQGTGLMLGAVLGTVAGAYLSAQTGHWVGGSVSDAQGLPFFHWSTTGGDLRIAHFAGLHAMQVIPLAAWLWPHRRTIWLAAAGMTVLTAALLLQAVAAIPLFAA